MENAVELLEGGFGMNAHDDPQFAIDDLAAKAGGYFVMPSKEEMAFTDLFFNICNQFGIHYASASPKARFFVDEVTRVTWAHMHGEKAAPSFSAFAKSDISA
jgi:hypothetical protein